MKNKNDKVIQLII